MRWNLNLVVIHLIGWVGLSLPWTVQACSCLPEDPLQGAFENTRSDVVVVQATLLEQLNSTSVFENAYSARIIHAWKGCSIFKDASTAVIKTSSESSLCGVLFLKMGETYLLSGSRVSYENKSAVSINSCGFQAQWSVVNASRVIALSKNFTNCTCTPQSCGPRPGLPNVRCPDGITVAGPRNCSYNQKLGACAWEIVQCPTCQKQSDCRKGQFCSAGKCRAVGTCTNNIDCWNPLNQYAKSCTGPSRCKNSKCSLDCQSGCPCPSGSPVVKCFADPCAVTPCEEPYVSCTANYCGGCNAIFYNSSGYQVCNVIKSSNNTRLNTTCSSESCGIQPAVAALLCPDGSPSKTTIECLYNFQSQACRWNISSTCPITSSNVTMPKCKSQDCGIQPMVTSILCPDGRGSKVTAACAYNLQTNACEWNITATCPDCNATACTPY